MRDGVRVEVAHTAAQLIEQSATNILAHFVMRLSSQHTEQITAGNVFRLEKGIAKIQK